MHQCFRPALEQHLDFGFILNGRRHAAAESWVLENVTCFVLVLWGICLRDRCVLGVQKSLVTARMPLRRWANRFAAHAFARAPLTRGCSRRVRFVSVL